jgi:abortive infection bacteriophage resistance protein
MKYNKPPLNIDQQIQLLRKRGLIINDAEKVKSYLSNVSYYRLSAYALPFQLKDDKAHKFIEHTSFDKILNLYLFDRELRLLILDVIERLEIAFRTQVIYNYSNKHGAWWYEDPKHFTNNFFYSKNLSKIDDEVERSGEVFMALYEL